MLIFRRPASGAFNAMFSNYNLVRILLSEQILLGENLLLLFHLQAVVTLGYNRWGRHHIKEVRSVPKAARPMERGISNAAAVVGHCPASDAARDR